MERIRGFEKVTGEHQKYPDSDVLLPRRADSRSAGYDMYLPTQITLKPGQKTILWSDVKAYMQEDEYLALHVRSSLGIKQGIILSNITGIIDSSYYENESNDGNIGFALLNTSGKDVTLYEGERVCQAIFQKYLRADNDETLHDARTGGVGSSGK